MKIISVREYPELKDMIIEYFQKTWGTENTMKVYEDCISNSIGATGPLPQWYMMVHDNETIGCAGLVTNDFISRMDLYPWICAVFIEEKHRGNAYGEMLLNRAKEDARKGGFTHVYLSTDHIGYYEKYGFEYIGNGYHPWGDSSRIYSLEL